ncbi:MAG: glycine betaine ABC transporter substrate-binding protein [Burkholderiales bacterium]|nr:glycine betaine ABC transporter substrate-binding protein [Burkholderiales bacterium]
MLATCISNALAAPLVVGSKRFTESYVLSEIIRQTAVGAGERDARHQQGLGNTSIVLGALQARAIDLYPEYTGTIAREILKLDTVPPLAELNRKLAGIGLEASAPLGFNNTYALAMPASRAAQLGIRSLSDLAAHPQLRLGFSQEFIGRADGWPGLQRAYQLPFTAPRGLDHGLAYDAIAQGQVDVIDIYSTDAKLDKYGLTVLLDDRGHFPRYDAVLLHRAGLAQEFPAAWKALKGLEGRIDEAAMRRMNAEAELEGKSFAKVAADWMVRTGAAAGTAVQASTAAAPQGAKPVLAVEVWHKLLAPDLARLTLEHLTLVFLSLAASIALGVPLGILAAKRPQLSGTILGITGVIQTIPALALLAFLIPLTGLIGLVPAFIALTLFALLPIVRNTHAGLTQTPPGLREAALSLGLPPAAMLRHVELPLALPTLLAGIRTAAVINVGTATIAAFIGAGGYGERIVTGLALNDHATLLAGALPAAVLALLIEFAFGLAEKKLVRHGRPPADALSPPANIRKPAR